MRTATVTTVMFITTEHQVKIRGFSNLTYYYTFRPSLLIFSGSFALSQDCNLILMVYQYIFLILISGCNKGTTFFRPCSILHLLNNILKWIGLFYRVVILYQCLFVFVPSVLDQDYPNNIHQCLQIFHHNCNVDM